MRSLVGLVISALLLSGCMSIGRSYDQSVAAEVHLGMTEQEVVAKLGRPYTRTDMTNGRYQFLYMHNQANGVVGKSRVQSDSFDFGPDHRVISVGASTDISGRS